MAGIIKDGFKIGGVPQSASRHVAMSTSYDIYSDTGEGIILIGFINSITINNTRTVTQIRHLNSVDAGIAVDSTVTPDAPTLSFNGFYVYNSGEGTSQLSNVVTGKANTNPQEAVGPTIGRISGVQLLMSLDQQQTPFDIVVKHVNNSAVAAGDTTQSGTIVGVYKNCTTSSMSTPINIGNAGVSDSGNISVGYVASDIG